MKYVIVSDIHGCLPRLEQVLDFFEKGGYDMLLMLGDILNYGPRNGVPEGLDAMGIVERLNPLADKILAVRGNCDSEVDQMLLSFPCLADYAMVAAGSKKLFLTHGHLFCPENLPPMGIDAFLSGHTHLWELRRSGNLVVCNTGSVTFPKDGREATFATLEEDGTLCVRSLSGAILSSIEI